MASLTNLTEEQRRVDAKLGRATAKYMSDARWLALFAALRSAGVSEVRWKFVRDDRVFFQPVPDDTELFADRLGDVLPAPHAAFREIEWLEVPSQRAELFATLRSSGKEFPWRESAEGLRLVAYEW